MGNWTHNICFQCWVEYKFTETGYKVPPRIVELTVYELDSICCFCGHRNIEGIYIREDPNIVLCKGNHLEILFVVKPE